jgi:hypothetical protein
MSSFPVHRRSAAQVTAKHTLVTGTPVLLAGYFEALDRRGHRMHTLINVDRWAGRRRRAAMCCIAAVGAVLAMAGSAGVATAAAAPYQTCFLMGSGPVCRPVAGHPRDAIMLLAHVPYACHLVDHGTVADAWVYCWNGHKHHVKLDPTGRYSLTATTPIPMGLGGPGEIAGTRVKVGRFRCAVLRAAIECVVAATGRGFRLDKFKIVAVGSSSHAAAAVRATRAKSAAACPHVTSTDALGHSKKWRLVVHGGVSCSHAARIYHAYIRALKAGRCPTRICGVRFDGYICSTLSAAEIKESGGLTQGCYKPPFHRGPYFDIYELRAG